MERKSQSRNPTQRDEPKTRPNQGGRGQRTPLSGPAEPASRLRQVEADLDRKRQQYFDALARAEELGSTAAEVQTADLLREAPRDRVGGQGAVVPAAGGNLRRQRNPSSTSAPRAAEGLAKGVRTPSGGAVQAAAQAAARPSDQVGRPGRQVRAPPADVFDEGENLRIEIEMPGVRKDQVQIVGRKQGITVSATSKPRSGDEALLSERSEIEYRREIPLGLEIKAGDAAARFQNGILIIEVPKRNPKEGLKRIEIED